MQHEDGGLLDYPCGLDVLVAEEHVGRDRPLRRELRDQEPVEPVEAGELLVDPGQGS